MSDKELFERILESIAKRYCLEVKSPYGDTYIQIYNHGEIIAEFNYGGCNILANMKELTYQLNANGWMNKLLR